MKRLDQLKLFVFALLATVMFGCEDPVILPIDDDPDLPIVKQDVPVQGTLYAYSIEDVYNNPGFEEISYAHFQVSGEIDTEEPELIVISHSHLALFDEDGGIKFKKGEFQIYGQGENTLYGTYFGFGMKRDGQFSAEWMLKVDGGTGKYDGASGYLTEVIKTFENEISDRGGDPGFKVDLSGNIYLPENVE